MKSICVFGDSISWGAWDTKRGGWVSRLWHHVAGREGDDYVEVYNLSVSGGTSRTILDRFETEARIRNADALIFQTGGNDALYESDPAKLWVAPDQFRSTIADIIVRAKAITPHVLFCEVANCDEAKTMPVSWGSYHYTNENISRYVAIMKEVCESHGVPFLSLGPLDDSDFEDGLHPNADGHEKIFRSMQDFLLTHAWI